MRPDRQLWLALLLAALVLLPRALLIAQAHSECYDDEYHLLRGARFLMGSLEGMAQTDPPLGEGLTALPAVLVNTRSGWSGGLYDHSLRPESLLLLTALWRSLLFLPILLIAFHWCRSLYGTNAAWLALALLLVEPTFAAHVPLAALDALGVSGALLGCFLAWRYFEKPTRGRLALAAIGVAAALLLKHTTVLLPLVVLGYAGLWWGVRPLLERQGWRTWRMALPSRLRAVVMAIFIGALAVWALTLFNFSRPDLPPPWQQERTRIHELLDRPLPAGLYIGSVLRGKWHAGQGHPSYLFGEMSRSGWWYYFPVVMTYKVPIGIGLVLLLGLLSLRRTRPCFAEWSLLLPLLAWTALMLGTSINIGLRHFLPAYVFILLIATRCLARAGRGERIVVWSAVAVAALHVLSYHPDYISYLNFPRHKAYLEVSDSNLDWGQSLKQVRRWIDHHPQPERTVHLLYFGDPNSERRIRYYLGDRVSPVLRRAPLPRSGLLIASPVWVAGPFDRANRYAALRAMEPIDVIGHSMLVFDLDRPLEAQ